MPLLLAMFHVEQYLSFLKREVIVVYLLDNFIFLFYSINTSLKISLLKENSLKVTNPFATQKACSRKKIAKNVTKIA